MKVRVNKARLQSEAGMTRKDLSAVADAVTIVTGLFVIFDMVSRLF